MRPGLEGDHSPPSSSEDVNEWSYMSTPLDVFTAWYLVKHRGNFTSTSPTDDRKKQRDMRPSYTKHFIHVSSMKSETGDWRKLIGVIMGITEANKGLILVSTWAEEQFKSSCNTKHSLLCHIHFQTEAFASYWNKRRPKVKVKVVPVLN